MIDLIIPYYNNPEGLLRTLDSINKKIFYITIVDDNSTIYIPQAARADRVLRYNANHGPGFARQFGIDHTTNPYIMFIDAGDIFLSKEKQLLYPKIIEKYPSSLYLGQYYYEEALMNFFDNRMHGKIYAREFLTKYNITFSYESSYVNEDIGFNRACRLIAQQKEEPIYEINEPIVKWIKEPNSLTQMDNDKTLYSKQTRGLTLVTIHTVEILRANNVDPTNEIHNIALALFYWFVRTAATRPDFLQNAWSGAKLFYDTYKQEIQTTSLTGYNQYFTMALEYRNKINFPINVLRFARDLWLYEEVPERYKNIK